MQLRKTFTILIAWSSLTCQLSAQGLPQLVEKPHAPMVWRPYIGARVPPVRLKNSNRLYDLIRGGKFYLTVQDAIALAIENNLDLEVNRYGPVSAEWNLERAQAGGALPGVTGGTTVANQAASGQGVVGSQASAGLSSVGGGGGGTALKMFRCVPLYWRSRKRFKMSIRSAGLSTFTGANCPSAEGAIAELPAGRSCEYIIIPSTTRSDPRTMN